MCAPLNKKHKEEVKRLWSLLLLFLRLVLEGRQDGIDEEAGNTEEGTESKAPAFHTNSVNEEIDLRIMLAGLRKRLEGR
jgi:hypothetical protein